MPGSLSKRVLKSCRLCQQIPGSVEVTSNNEFIGQVYECTKIKIDNEQMNCLPKKVCRFCKVRIERFFTYIQEVRTVDEKLRSQFTECSNTGEELHIVPLSDDLEQCADAEESSSDAISQVHMQGQSNMYCSNCTETFDDILLYKSHSCIELNGCGNEIECDDITVGNVNELKAAGTFDESCEDHKVDCDSVSVQNANFHEYSKLSDIIRSTGLTQEDVEVEISMEDEEVVDEIADDLLSSTKEEVVDEFTDDLITSIKEETATVDVTTMDVKSEVDGEADSDGYYPCILCKKRYRCTSHLRAHQKSHGNRFPCPFKNCHKVCTSAYSFGTHTLKHKGKLPFICSVCGKRLTTKCSLKSHEKIHAKVKEYTCKECNISFAIRNTLKAHQRKVHEGVRFYCSQCPQTFTSKGSLNRHELVHKGIKNFSCETCEAKFYTNKELMNHQRYHKGVRAYKCDQCYKTFFEKHHLTIHNRFHTGERPYVCKIAGCRKSFTDSQGLAQHGKSRHVL